MLEGVKGSLKQNDYLNLPDLQFFNWCNQQYRINRGVYKTIDQWFYAYGFKEILQRRLYLLSFLRFVLDKKRQSEQQKFIRFGNGGLTKQITDFFSIIDKESEKPSLYLYETYKSL
jgi:riboflavin kinase